MNQIGSKIKSLREQCGFTQQQVAQIVGVDDSMICKIENGQSAGSLPTLRKIASALGVSITELLNDKTA